MITFTKEKYIEVFIMKKLFFVYLILVSFVLNGISTYAKELTLTYDGSTHKYTGNIYKLKVNDEIVNSDIPPIIINDRSLVPVRAIFEKLGATVLWDAKNRKVSVAHNGKDVVLKINDDYALINGSKYKMEVPAKIINDRTMVPLRFVGEQLNMEVGWYADKGEITISSKKKSELSNLSNINYIKGKSGQSVAIDLDSFPNYKITRLSSPDRIVVDFTNTKVVTEKPSIVVNEDFLKTVRCSQFEDKTARVVLNVEGQPQYQVTENKNQLLLNIQKKVPTTSITETQLSEEVSVPADNQLNIKHIDKKDYEAVIIGVKDCSGYNAFALSSPDRIVIDIPKAATSNQQKTVNIGSKLIKSVRCASKDTGGSRWVIDTNGVLKFRVVESDGLLIAYIAKSLDLISTASRGESDTAVVSNGNNLNVSYKADEQDEKVILSLKDYSNYNITKQLDLNRIVIDIPDSTASSSEKSINIKSSQIENVRYASINNSSSRVIIQLNAQSQYIVVEEAGALILKIIPGADIDGSQTTDSTIKGTPKPTATGTVKPTVTSKPTVTVTPKPTATITLKPTVTVTAKPTTTVTPKSTATVTPKPTVAKTFIPTTTETPNSGSGNTAAGDSIKIEHNYSDGADNVIIWAKDCRDYNVWMITEPNRIVVDIPNYKAGKEQILNINSSNITSIRSAQFEDTTTRVVIDITSQLQYNVIKSDEQIFLRIERPLYKNITYSNSGDRKYFTLHGVKLTEGGENLKSLYTDNYGVEGKVYTITFPSELADLGNGTMKINDNMVNDVEIETNADTNQTTLTFYTKEFFDYEIITRETENNTTITLISEASKKDRLIVIDAGHGGSDPGASHYGVNEKDLNLDIAKRLNVLLEKNNIKTYMTREDDTYVGLYERAYIANNMNATLFLSIHNNAYYAKYSGTETLYYPERANSTGFTSKRFAQLIQSELVGDLGTYDRGIVERPNLVVLKATKMPAALAEIAFMSNSGDIAKLKSEEFRQKTAQALCDAILKALDEVD